MAVLDIERGAVVIRIVYDGPPEAGKTTSLRALSASLARPMATPAETDGRTLYFDWVEYKGGLFEGNQILCQIVTVPGQTVLAHRRHNLLETADVVVFVSDSAPGAVPTTAAYLKTMQETLDALPGPRVGVILQANKRDRANAVDLSTLRDTAPGIAVLESVATTGQGVREAFVFAVRLALDRVRELLRDRALRLGPPDVQSSAELLAQLTRNESPEQSVVASALQEVLAEVAAKPAAPPVIATPESDAPWPPDASVPAGMIWPPIDGRIALHEASATAFTPRVLPDGDWIGEVPGWRFHSPRQASYTNAEVGRRGLVEWARLHAGGQRWLSSPRVVVLAASGEGTWRLWQIVKNEESLRDVLTRELHAGSAQDLLRRMLDAGRVLLAATDSLGFVPCRLPLRIDTIGESRGVPLYVGFLPDPFLLRPPQPFQPEQRPSLLRRELSALASTALRVFPRESFPPLQTVLRESDPPAVVGAIRDVLRDAGLSEAYDLSATEAV
ncbi:MAG TPA: GTPase domain-containing protein [Thermoanaerobaculia bacterium]|nr:GTPase domain-containing protein [Thermoanaerobaculia bacterium]